MSSQRSRIRKQVHKLTVDDLVKFPVWEFAMDEEGVKGQDECTVRPFVVNGPVSASDGMLICRAKFVLVDGTKVIGHISVVDGKNYDLTDVQPIILVPNGQVGFWYGVGKIKTEDLAKNYVLLSKEASQVFPIKYESDAPLKDGSISGSLEGFASWSQYPSKKITFVR